MTGSCEDLSSSFITPGKTGLDTSSTATEVLPTTRADEVECPFLLRTRRRHLHAKPLLLSSILLLLAAAASCSDQPQWEGPGHRPQTLALSPQQELEIGRETYNEILSKAQVAQNGREVQQVRKVGARIAAVVAIEPLMREINLHVSDYQFEWEYAVLQRDQVNAFCLPGGKSASFRDC